MSKLNHFGNPGADQVLRMESIGLFSDKDYSNLKPINSKTSAKPFLF